MNKIERIKMVKAMEYITRNLNDEEIFMTWLTLGVADGDIDYGDLSVNADDTDPHGVDYYTEDKTFADIMDLFLKLMKAAYRSGGLYCDGVVSKEIDWSKEG